MSHGVSAWDSETLCNLSIVRRGLPAPELRFITLMQRFVQEESVLH